MNLCIPYASVYMLALGLNEPQVGLVATVYMLSQVVFAFLSGPITDKMGRRTATLVYDFIAWSVPCVIWWYAGGRTEVFWLFLIAALLNGTMQITVNSWECLLVEDAEQDQITGISSLVILCGQLSGIFAPITAILISRFDLQRAIRILYVNGFFVMTLKLTLLYIFCTETRMGKLRMEETRGKSLFSLATGYGGVIKIILKSRGTIFTLIVAVIVGIIVMVNTTFWQVIVSKKLLVPDHLLPVFHIFRSAVAIIFLFLIAPHLTVTLLKRPLLTGFSAYFAGQLLLILAPVEGPLKYIVLFVSLVFDGFGLGYLHILILSLKTYHVNPGERARVYAIMNMFTMAAVSPFGWISGLLSNISRNLPFVLNLSLLFIGICVTLASYKEGNQITGSK